MKRTSTLTKQIISLLMCLTMLLTCVPLTASAEGKALSDDVVILYTNDVHTYIDDALSYDVIAAIKNDLKKEYKHVLLADAGDHIQGTAYGSMDKGKSIIELMNAADYDVATLGNHEFDYNMQGCKNAISWADFPYISCNFYHETNGMRGANVLDSYVIFNCGAEKVAFVGISTPETLSKTTPAYFQDGNGNFIYGFSGGENGSNLQQDVQKAIDAAKSAGATTVIGLGHLGDDPASKPWTSEETIAGVSGLDAFIDGHSHTVMEGKEVKDKSGNSVMLTQTGEYFNRIGMMIVDSQTGKITTDFIECTGNEQEGYKLTSDLYKGTALISDDTVKQIKDQWLKEIDNKLGQNIGKAMVTLDNYDSNGNRLVRSQETNSGDFAADALYYLFDNMALDVDVAVMNGGGIRNKAITGDISYKTCKDMHPFGNVACLQTVTGQQILDMLEWGARYAGASEDGSFLHVSGITYKIDSSIKNTTQASDLDVWLSGPSKYRVYDVMVYNKDTNYWDKLDLNAKYNLAGYNYTLRDLGGGFAMLNGAVNVLDYVMEDYMVLANYVTGFKNGIVSVSNSPLLEKYPGLLMNYGDVNGSGRINVVNGAQNEIPDLWVGGTKVTQNNASDVFGDGKVSYNVETNTLTLNNYTYTGEGYTYRSNGQNAEQELYSAAIYSKKPITIKLIGSNALNNSFNGLLKGYYGNGVVVEGDVRFTGGGNLNITGAYAIYAEGEVAFDDADAFMESTDDAIRTLNGDVSIQNGCKIYIDSDSDAIYAGKDILIQDSEVTIQAQGNGLYAYGGNVKIDSKKVGVAKRGPWLEGTKVSIQAGGQYGVFARKDVTVDDKLDITNPKNAQMKEMIAEEGNYKYKTITDGQAIAKNIELKPLGYTVSIRGLKNNMAALVPAGQSLNSAYCELYGVEDFSKILNTEKEGYIFGGWYTDEECTDGKEFHFNDAINANITIYAKWVSENSSDTNQSTNQNNTVQNTPKEDKVPVSPQTADSNSVYFWSVALFMSLGCMFLYVSNESKRNRKESFH